MTAYYKAREPLVMSAIRGFRNTIIPCWTRVCHRCYKGRTNIPHHTAISTTMVDTNWFMGGFTSIDFIPIAISTAGEEDNPEELT